jgi:site-specific DNA-cytosine methylase
MLPVIISLFDHSGVWSGPYKEAGYDVIQIDLKHGHDVRDFKYLGFKVRGVIAAPPCTDFTNSGAQYWGAKDADGRTHESLALVDATMRIIMVHDPDWWVLENPQGRLQRWLGPESQQYDPCDYGDGHTKKTYLWGRFNMPDKKRVPHVTGNDTPIMKLGGKSERTKDLRSVTPPGFARKFFEVNP